MNGAARAAYRRRLRRRMTATVKVTTWDGTSTYDPATDDYIPNVVVVYEGPAMVRPTPQQPVDVTVAGEYLHVQTYDVTLPAEVVMPTEDSTRVTVTASAGDAQLVGKVFTVDDVPLDDWKIGRRVVCKLVV